MKTYGAGTGDLAEPQCGELIIESTEKTVEHFWTPPSPGERLLGMVKYQDLIVVATDRGVYVIAPPGRGINDHEVHKIGGVLTGVVTPVGC